MTRKIYWLCDALGILGATLFLFGIYFAWALSTVLMIGGLMLMAYASRLSYVCKHDSD